MNNELRVVVNQTFTVYLRNNGNVFYVHRVEHNEITGYSFPDVDENTNLMKLIRRRFLEFWNFDIVLTSNHLKKHCNMKFN